MVKVLSQIMPVVLALLIGAVELVFTQEKVGSVYSDLAAKRCKTLTLDEETGASTQTCPGVARYQLLVHDDDARQSITVITPDGKEHDLDFWGVVTHGFSSVGEKAEWRVIRKNRKLSPIALIVRVNASEDPVNPTRITSYLTVTKLTPSEICVTHKIPHSANANANARRAADKAKSAPCLKDLVTDRSRLK